jgi:hypothetical protein
MLIDAEKEKEMDPSPDDAFQVDTLITGDETRTNIEPKTYCKLGHFHLLLDDYSKGLAYL